jgi:hypothetical protein
LWIFNRAIELICSRKSLGEGNEMRRTYDAADRNALKLCLADNEFVNGVMRGIYDADNSGNGDPATSGFYFSAHFWNPRSGRGGWWDKTDKNTDHNAYVYGTRYFGESLQDEDPKSSGHKLGLAIHYLQDLTQPMHCGLYPNAPGPLELFTILYLMAPPDGSPFLFGTSPSGEPVPENWRHENYEQWVLRKQHAWKYDTADLDLDIPVFRVDEGGSPQWGGYWHIAAEHAFGEWGRWKGSDKSPIGRSAPSANGAEPAFDADYFWGASASKMIRLAQRLVINLLLSWAALSKLGAKHRGSSSFVFRGKAIGACRQGGSRGAQLWGVDWQGILRSRVQDSPGGGWSAWSGDWSAWSGQSGSSGSPFNVIALTAAQANDGRVQLWALDYVGNLYCNWQTSAGGDWYGWSPPNWNGAPKLTRICACLQGDLRAQLWGVDQQGLLRSTVQEKPGGNWSRWSDEWAGSPRKVIALTAAQQNNGCVQLWALTDVGDLYSNYQTSAGGDWYRWSPPNWNGAPKLTRICASLQGGSRGVQLWGVDQRGLLRSTFQETPGGNWSSPWSADDASPNLVDDLAAVQQSDGRVQLWALTPDGDLYSHYQTSPGGGWSAWLS